MAQVARNITTGYSKHCSLLSSLFEVLGCARAGFREKPDWVSVIQNPLRVCPGEVKRKFEGARGSQVR